MDWLCLQSILHTGQTILLGQHVVIAAYAPLPHPCPTQLFCGSHCSVVGGCQTPIVAKPYCGPGNPTPAHVCVSISHPCDLPGKYPSSGSLRPACDSPPCLGLGTPLNLQVSVSTAASQRGLLEPQTTSHTSQHLDLPSPVRANSSALPSEVPTAHSPRCSSQKSKGPRFLSFFQAHI